MPVRSDDGVEQWARQRRRRDKTCPVTTPSLRSPITNRSGPRVRVVGQLCMVAGLAAVLATARLRFPLITAARLVPIGAGESMAMPSVTGVVPAGVPQEWADTVSAVFNTFRQVGRAVAIAVFGDLIANPSSFVIGMRTSDPQPAGPRGHADDEPGLIRPATRSWREGCSARAGAGRT